MKAFSPCPAICALALLLAQPALAALPASAGDPATAQAPTPALLERVGQLGDEAQAFLDRQDYARATQRCRQAIALVEAERGADDPLIEDPLTMLTDIYAAADRPAELETAYLRLIPLFVRLHGEDNPGAQGKMIDLVNFYREHERFADAIPWLRRLIASKSRSDGVDAPGIELMHLALAHCDFMVGNQPDAATEYQRVIELITLAGADHRKYTGIPMIALAEVYAAEDNRDKAISTARQAVSILEEGYGADSSLACDARQRLAKILTGSGERAQPGTDPAVDTACRQAAEDAP